MKQNKTGKHPYRTGPELQDARLLDKGLTGPIPGDRLTSKKSGGSGPDGNP